MLAVVLPQIGPICPKFGREFWEVIISRTLSTQFAERYAIELLGIPLRALYAKSTKIWLKVTIPFGKFCVVQLPAEGG
jgi:hypothetical protein